jgi:hypothetical protein
VNILSSSPDYAEFWRVAEMLLDPKSEHSIITRKLLEEVLKISVQPWNNEFTAPPKSNRNQPQVEGFVDIQWCIDGSPETTHGPTRFLVTSIFDPEFDLMLGKKDCYRYGFAKPKKRWH